MSVPPLDPLSLQRNVKSNAADVNNFLKDLQSWSTEVKTKDRALKEGKMVLTKVPLETRPIRGKAAASAAGAGTPVVVLPSSLDADQQRFATEKSAGNAAFTSGKYEVALTHYTQCMLLQPSDVISTSNRSQTFLKLHRYHEAESDATLAIELDTNHVKSLFRRAQARKELRKYAGACMDLETLLKVDAANKPAQQLLKECRELLQKQQEARAKATQPIVSAKPIAATTAPAGPLKASVSTATATLPTASTAASEPSAAQPKSRRMVIQEDSDDEDEDDQETVPINKVAAVATPAAAVATVTVAPVSPVAAAKPATPTAAPVPPQPAPASPLSPASPSSASSASSPSSSSSLRAPKTAYDFDATFRSIRHDSQQIAEYFKLIPDYKQYGMLLKTALDGTLLESVSTCIDTILLPSHDFSTIFTILRGLIIVPRFQVTKMMMSGKDKKIMEKVCKEMMKGKEKTGATEEEIRQIAKEFGVTL